MAYFSAQGHTRRVAERIAQDTGGNTFEVLPTQVYSDDDLGYNDDTSRVSKEYQDQNLRDVSLRQTTPDGWADYDTVFVGYPIWWGDYASPITHFASDNDFTGKRSSRSARLSPPAWVVPQRIWPLLRVPVTGRLASALGRTRAKAMSTAGSEKDEHGTKG